MCFYLKVKQILHTTAILSLVLPEVLAYSLPPSSTEVEGAGNKLVQGEIWA
jgi:hypothetical protein